MQKKKLTESRVHEIIEQYAAEHDGEIPSSTNIVLLNDGNGSPNSATIYRKTYMAKHSVPTENKNPLEGFPTAIAKAVSEMQGSIEAEAQLKIEKIREHAAEEVRALQEQLEINQKQLADQLEANSQKDLALNESDIECKRLAEQLRSVELLQATTSAKLLAKEAELSACQAALECTQDQVDTLETLFGDLQLDIRKQADTIDESNQKQGQVLAICDAISKSQTSAFHATDQTLKSLNESVQLHSENEASLIEANRNAADKFTTQLSQYESEITRLKSFEVENNVLISRCSDMKATIKDLAAKLESKPYSAFEAQTEQVALLRKDIAALSARVKETTPDNPKD